MQGTNKDLRKRLMKGYYFLLNRYYRLRRKWQRLLFYMHATFAVRDKNLLTNLLGAAAHVRLVLPSSMTAGTEEGTAACLLPEHFEVLGDEVTAAQFRQCLNTLRAAGARLFLFSWKGTSSQTSSGGMPKVTIGGREYDAFGYKQMLHSLREDCGPRKFNRPKNGRQRRNYRFGQFIRLALPCDNASQQQGIGILWAWRGQEELFQPDRPKVPAFFNFSVLTALPWARLQLPGRNRPPADVEVLSLTTTAGATFIGHPNVHRPFQEVLGQFLTSGLAPYLVEWAGPQDAAMPAQVVVNGEILYCHRGALSVHPDGLAPVKGYLCPMASFAPPEAMAITQADEGKHIALAAPQGTQVAAEPSAPSAPEPADAPAATVPFQPVAPVTAEPWWHQGLLVLIPAAA